MCNKYFVLNQILCDADQICTQSSINVCQNGVISLYLPNNWSLKCW